MKKKLIFFGLTEKVIGVFFWNNVPTEPLRKNKLAIRDEEYDITLSIQKLLPIQNTPINQGKMMNKKEVTTIFEILVFTP